jgi:prevent-host-death family protein
VTRTEVRSTNGDGHLRRVFDDGPVQDGASAAPRANAAERATLCDMRTVTHREMRNQSAEILRQVEAGETLLVTNNGRAAAVISPAGRSAIDELAEQGQVRLARRAPEELRSISRRRPSLTSAQLVADARGSW